MGILLFGYESAKNMFYVYDVLTILVDLGVEADTYIFGYHSV